MWMDFMSKNRNDDSIATFKEHVEILVAKEKSFVHELLADSYGNDAGCTWQTSVMRDNFERVGSFLPIDAINKGINQ